jgi:hypothetical protein
VAGGAVLVAALCRPILARSHGALCHRVTSILIAANEVTSILIAANEVTR